MKLFQNNYFFNKHYAMGTIKEFALFVTGRLPYGKVRYSFGNNTLFIRKFKMFCCNYNEHTQLIYDFTAICICLIAGIYRIVLEFRGKECDYFVIEC